MISGAWIPVEGNEELNIENFCQNAGYSGFSCLDEGWIFHVKLYQRFPDQLQVSLRWTIVDETMNTADFSDNTLSTHFPITDATAFLFQDQRPEIIKRERPASIKKKSKDQKDDDEVEHFWTIYDDKDFSCALKELSKEKLDDYMGKLKKVSSTGRDLREKLNCKPIAYHHLRMKDVDLLDSFSAGFGYNVTSMQDATIFTEFTNTNAYPDGVNEDDMCIRFSSDDAYVTLNQTYFKEKFAEALEDNISGKFPALSFRFRIYDYDLVLKDGQKVPLLEMGDLTVEIGSEGPIVGGERFYGSDDKWKADRSMCYKEDKGVDKTPMKCEPLEIILTVGNLKDAVQKHITSKLAMFTNKIEIGTSTYVSSMNPSATDSLHAAVDLEDGHESLEEFLDDVFKGVEMKMFGIGVSQYSISLDIIEKFDKKFYSNLMNDKKPEVSHKIKSKL